MYSLAQPRCYTAVHTGNERAPTCPYSEQVPWRAEPRPTTRVWHGIGLTAYLSMLALYAGAGHFYGAGFSHRFVWVLCGAVVIAVVVAFVGRWRGWQERRALLFGWPVASLLATVLVGAVAPAATQNLPGIITVTFGYIGLTCSRWRSLAFVPLGVAAFVVGGSKALPGSLTTVVLAAAMWVIVAEVPAWLISQLEEQSALLRKIAHTDALTQLLNRSTLGPQLSAHANGSAVVLIDLDNFKRYNDGHGHEAGDELLIAFADAIRWSIRNEDVAFRIGGDEFLLMLVGADRTEAEQVLDRLRHRWAEIGEPVSFSAGIASGEQDVMRLADEHMYANKRSRDVAAD
ncbi:GGDEF domain-containing protein [Mycobacterium sp. Aquia_213]|uniref:GGDEF domain-containing protein n=1 Tax=Mycobacterium sp. Aquia_213 TaxID=2991728 RepID=UPI00226DB586|nr:GGDEF domain-containing protein [Mycobacterium sp. Aquia_213]WAC93863.1 GGDEF domain-containing protein [Mycobacterium sp. Aquia_213]